MEPELAGKSTLVSIPKYICLITGNEEGRVVKTSTYIDHNNRSLDKNKPNTIKPEKREPNNLASKHQHPRIIKNRYHPTNRMHSPLLNSKTLLSYLLILVYPDRK